MATRRLTLIGVLLGALLMGVSGCTGSDPLVPGNYEVRWVGTTASGPGVYTCATVSIRNIELRPVDPQANEVLGVENIGFVTPLNLVGPVPFVPSSAPCTTCAISCFELPQVILSAGRYEIVKFFVRDATLSNATTSLTCNSAEDTDLAGNYPLADRIITVGDGHPNAISLVLDVNELEDVLGPGVSCDAFYANIENILRFE